MSSHQDHTTTNIIKVTIRIMCVAMVSSQKSLKPVCRTTSTRLIQKQLWHIFKILIGYFRTNRCSPRLYAHNWLQCYNLIQIAFPSVSMWYPTPRLSTSNKQLNRNAHTWILTMTLSCLDLCHPPHLAGSMLWWDI